MFNVLVYGMSDVHGGIENIIMNYYRNFDRQKIHFDFICLSENDIAYQDEILSYGSVVYHLSNKYKNPVRYKKQIKKIFKEHSQKYDCLWFNVSDLANIDALKLAQKFGIKRIIVHSHNSRMISKGLKKVLKIKLHNYHKNKIDNYATDFWACSNVAAQWLYPKKIISKVKIIKNAINVSKNKFDEPKRKKLRKKYHIDDQYVIGNVGRLTFQKNQSFILKVFKLVSENIPNAKMIFVGDGEDKEKLINEAKALNIIDRVKFVGLQNNVDEWYDSFDLFFFPSLFEGLSLALLEAQANGVPILTSDKVSPEEVKVNKNFNVEKLDMSIDKWTADIKNILNNEQRLDKKTIERNFVNSGYDIKIAAKKLQSVFLNS